MKPNTIFQTLFFLFLISYSLNSTAQKAVLYNFDFRIPDAYRHEIQEYDQNGNKEYIKDLSVHYVDTVDDVLTLALLDEKVTEPTEFVIDEVV